jgi:hypothetical protein
MLLLGRVGWHTALFSNIVCPLTLTHKQWHALAAGHAAAYYCLGLLLLGQGR